MNIIRKILLKLKIKKRFLLEQKWGTKRPSDPFSISKSVLKKYLPANPVIIDCGAHVGSDSIELAKVFPKAKIHCFEPVPAIFDKLKHNTRNYPNIYCYKLALSNEIALSDMFVSSGTSDASSSLLQPTGHLDDHPDVYFKDKINVETITLDEWAGKNNINRVDFLWLDMQGFELQMLKASERILPGITCIHTEVSMKETYKNAVLYEDYRKWLEARGFCEVMLAIQAGADMGNALFVRS